MTTKLRNPAAAMVMAALPLFGCNLETDSALTARLGLLLATSSASGNSETSTLTISNVRDKGLVQSGFLIGTMSSSDNTVTVSVDGGAGAAATLNGTSWSFALPTGSSTWRLFSSHSVTVQAFDSSGFVVGTTSITVRKGTNRDVNGDGYPDLMAGANKRSASRGTVYLYHGKTGGLSGGSAVGADLIATGTNASDEIGTSLAMGDINGDGYADLIQGAPGANTLTGQVTINHGSSTGATAVANTVIDGASTNDFFGMAVTAADINGDGFDDLVVGGDTGGPASQGEVYVFHGSAGGVTQTSATGANRTILGEGNNHKFGISVAAGDFNGDGFADVGVGAQEYSSGLGRVYIFSGAAGGITQTMASAANALLNGETTGDRLGASVRFMDLNADGLADLVAGAPALTTQTGRLYIHHGSGTLPTSGGIVTAATTTITGETTNSRFSQSMDAGDLNGDGFPELVVGAFQYNTNGGRAYIFTGSSSGITTTTAVSATTIISGESTGLDFSYALAISDLDGDGYKDLAAGSRKQAASTGAVHVFYGAATGVTATVPSSALTTLAGETGTDEFGGALF